VFVKFEQHSYCCAVNRATKLFLGLLLIAAVSYLFSKGEPSSTSISGLKAKNQSESVIPTRTPQAQKPGPVPKQSPTIESGLPDEPFNPNEWPLLNFPTPSDQTPTPEAIATPLATLAVDILVTPSPQATAKSEAALSLEALREAQNQAEQSDGMIRGRRSSTQVLADGAAAPTATPSDETTPLPRLSGQARGYTMPYFMQASARDAVLKQIQTLLEAQIDQVYLGVLSDGSFGKDFNFLDETIQKLSKDGRSLTLVIYITNGPTQRSFDTTDIRAGFNLISPLDFRELIQHDSRIRDRYLNMLDEALPSFELNKSLNSKSTNIVIPMLEDNLDQDGYRAIRALTQSKVSGLARIIRNPCPGCFDGNDTNTLGDGLESHLTSELSQLSADDGFSLDGIGYRFDSDPADTQLSTASVKQLLNTALTRKLAYFGLWRVQRQGRNTVGILHPDKRAYEIPSDEQSQVEIELLREGLTAAK